MEWFDVVNSSSPWQHGVQPGSWPELVLWSLSSRMLCFSSPHLVRQSCCRSNERQSLSHFCWDPIFTRERCCGHAELIAVATARGDASCWAGGFTFEHCCLGGGKSSCWDSEGLFSYERCCEVVSKGDGSDLPVIADILNGGCVDAAAARGCSQKWRTGLASAQLLAQRAVLQATLHLAQLWRSKDMWANIAAAAPAFLVAVVLTACLALVDQWAGKKGLPRELWQEAAVFIQVYKGLLSQVPQQDLSDFHIRSLDETLAHRVNQHHEASVNQMLSVRLMTINQQSEGFSDRQDSSFLSALQELATAVRTLGVEFIPIQGTLISLLRYGSFPAGRLSYGKRDVVDNDIEIMVFLERERDLPTVGAAISLALESMNWPPCINPHPQKYVCFSLRHDIPCKVELYLATKDHERRLIYFSRSCSEAGDCEYSQRFPLQGWDGQLPWDIVFPLSRCRMGGLHQRIFCPNRPLDFLLGWNLGEYRNQSAVVPMGKLRATDPCMALPVLSRDRDGNDPRNKRLQADGLWLEDLRLLHNYARGLQRHGFASFLWHLRLSKPCRWRQKRIMSGDPHAGLATLTQ